MTQLEFFPGESCKGALNFSEAQHIKSQWLNTEVSHRQLRKNAQTSNIDRPSPQAHIRGKTLIVRKKWSSGSNASDNHE